MTVLRISIITIIIIPPTRTNRHIVLNKIISKINIFLLHPSSSHLKGKKWPLVGHCSAAAAGHLVAPGKLVFGEVLALITARDQNRLIEFNRISIIRFFHRSKPVFNFNKNDQYLAGFGISLESDRVIYKKFDSVLIFSFDFQFRFYYVISKFSESIPIPNHGLLWKFPLLILFVLNI